MNNGKISVLSGAYFEKAYGADNYLIEETAGSGNICAIYFSSSGIYYPNTVEEFHKAFIDENRYEWYETRMSCASKHIFIRDVAKQFYITGISRELDTIEKIVSFLKEQTEGYRIITVGSSAGAYAATVAGIELGAEMIFCFSGYFNLNVLDKEVWPYIAKYSNDKNRTKWYDIHDLALNYRKEIIYFYPQNNQEDAVQSSFVADSKNIHFHKYSCKSDVHGVPFAKRNLEMMFERSFTELRALFEKLDERMISINVKPPEQILSEYERVIIFGAGTDGRKCHELICKTGYSKAIIFWDNSKGKQDMIGQNMVVERPSKIFEANTLIVIASRKHGVELCNQVVSNQYGGDWIFMEDLFCPVCRMVSELLENNA